MRSMLCALIVALCTSSAPAQSETFISRIIGTTNEVGDHGEFLIDEGLNTSREMFMRGEEGDRMIASEAFFILDAIREHGRRIATLSNEDRAAAVAEGEARLASRVDALNAMVRLWEAMRPTIQLDERIVRAVAAVNNIRSSIKQTPPPAPDTWPRTVDSGSIFSREAPPAPQSAGSSLDQRLNALQATTSALQARVDAAEAWAAQQGIQFTPKPVAPAPQPVETPSNALRQLPRLQSGGDR